MYVLWDFDIDKGVKADNLARIKAHAVFKYWKSTKWMDIMDKELLKSPDGKLELRNVDGRTVRHIHQLTP